MKRHIYLLGACLLALTPFLSNAQNTHFCGSTQQEQALFEAHPEAEQMQRRLDSLVRMPQGSNRLDTGEVYVIPLVFHVVHNYGTENISDEQIYDAVRILNEDYRKLNPDTNDIIPYFQALAGDARIEFRLAQVGPDLECTNGIDRIHSYKTYIGNDVSKLNPWPRSYYLNIWIVNQIPNNVAGYAYRPGSVAAIQASEIDGIIILSDYIGSIGTGTPGKSRALTHEIGHYLNLPHTWGNTNEPGVACGDDGIGDTPQTAGWTSCNLNGVSCPAATPENVQNYMEYSYCSNMFTHGQITVMRQTLESNESGRRSLWSNFNHNYTGINQPTECGPVADMYADKRFVCDGGSVQFNDATWRDDVLAYEWTFEGGSPATSTDASPTVSFSGAGWHKVTMQVQGANGSDLLEKDQYIYVNGSTSTYYGGFEEDFTDEQNFMDNWISFQMADEDESWHLTSTVGFQDGHSVMVDNYRTNPFDKDDLISPSVDMGTYNAQAPRYLNFRYSTAANTQNNEDRRDTLALLYSTDCGVTWYKFDQLTGNDLYTAGFDWRDFAPDRMSEWGTYAEAIPSQAYSANTLFKFQLNSGPSGNNLYLDEINISADRYSGIEEALQANSLNMFPNPTSGQVTVSYQLSSPAPVSISVLNMLGKEVLTETAGTQGAGSHEVSLKTSDLAGGVYFVTFTAGEQQVTQKLVVTAK